MSERGTDIARAARVLAEGKLVAFPTETVYGLGADASRESAVARIYAVKGRPRAHPLIVHLAPEAVLDDWAIEVPDVARRLAAALWPAASATSASPAPRCGSISRIAAGSRC